MTLTAFAATSGLAVENAYLIADESTGEALIVDPGEDVTELLVKAKGLHVKAILVTHGHFDHIAGLGNVVAATKAPIYAPAREADWLTDPSLNRSAMWAGRLPLITGPKADHLVQHGPLALTLAGHTVQARAVPGHTPGHLVYRIGDMVFCGDSVFAGTVARTDLPEGDPDALTRAIREEILTLDDAVTLLPGHGPATTVGHERRTNPYLRYLPSGDGR